MSVNYFWDIRRLEESQYGSPNILAIGDSWFWYPLYGGNLITELGEMVRTTGSAILIKGNNGAEAFDYVDGKYATQVREALRLFGSGLSAVFISGGGNDFAGFNDLRPLLNKDCSKATTAQECFKADPNGVNDFFDRIDLSYRRLIGLVYTHTRPGCQIFMHTYDYANPNGKGLIGASKWLKPALDDAGVEPSLHRQCVRYLIDRFSDTLEKIRETDLTNLHVVKGHGTLNDEDWANELHPTPEGFRKLAKRWKEQLVSARLARPS